MKVLDGKRIKIVTKMTTGIVKRLFYLFFFNIEISITMYHNYVVDDNIMFTCDTYVMNLCGIL